MALSRPFASRGGRAEVPEFRLLCRLRPPLVVARPCSALSALPLCMIHSPYPIKPHRRSPEPVGGIRGHDLQRLHRCGCQFACFRAHQSRYPLALAVSPNFPPHPSPLPPGERGQLGPSVRGKARFGNALLPPQIVFGIFNRHGMDGALAHPGSAQLRNDILQDVGIVPVRAGRNELFPRCARTAHHAVHGIVR